MSIKSVLQFSLLGVASALSQNVMAQKPVKGYPIAERLNSYKRIKLTTDTAKLSEAERKCIVHLIKAAKQADEIFWRQTYMEKEKALKDIKNDTLRKFIEINYGPWDRLNNDKPFVAGVGEKPKGANFYPLNFDMNQVPDDPNMKSKILNPYTIVVEAKVQSQGPPPPPQKPGQPGQPMDMPIPMEKFPLKNGKEIEIAKFGEYYQKNTLELMNELNAAAEAIQTEDPKFARYLRDRAASVMSAEFTMNDVQWLTLKSHLDIVIGPIENYEDKLTGQKTSFEAYVLVRDKEWGAKLDRYIALLPELQAGIPVEAAYKPAITGGTGDVKTDEYGNIVNTTGKRIEEPGFPPLPIPDVSLSQLAVFDAVYYAGDCNSGSKTIAVNLPNDERIQKYYGTRRSQLKNTMKAKFDHMVKPISEVVIEPSQSKNIKFDAFFSNVMFHEVAHGLGVKNLVKDSAKTAREALGPNYSAIEECKADVLGLYMVTKLFEKGELTGSLDDYYVTFVASIFRSVRFGASSAHGKANMITFNTLLQAGAISKQKSYYTVNVPLMKVAIEKLAAELLHLQGDGDVAGVAKMLETRGVVGESLQKDLKNIANAKIPVDLVFDQGIEALGLSKYNVEVKKVPMQRIQR